MTARRGFALLASVWLMVAIAAVAFEVSWLARARRLTTANVLEAEAARAAAESGLEHARARLTQALATSDGRATEAGPSDPWHGVAVRPETVTVGTARYAFGIRDDGATLDVNRASEQSLRALFVACGADDAVASRSSQRIADWRDVDGVRRAQGAERADYIAAGLRALPRDGAVQRVEELDDVLDMPTTSWDCVRPLLSVNGTGEVNVNTAPGEVLEALPGVGPEAAAALVAARRDRAPIRNFQEFTDRLPPGVRERVVQAPDQLLPLLAYDTHAVRVTARGWEPGSPVVVRAEALMVRTGGSVFVQWRRFR